MNAGSTGVTLTDTLTGANFVTGSFVLTTVAPGTGTLSTVLIGNQVEMTVTNQRTGVTIFTITYSAIETW